MDHVKQESLKITGLHSGHNHTDTAQAMSWHNLPRQVVSRTGTEERVGCPNHKGVLVAAGMKHRRQQLQHPT